MHRIVVYQALSWAEDSELVEAIEAAAGLERETVTERLAGAGPAYFEHLDEDAAREILGLLEARSVDADLEPMVAATSQLEWLRAEVPKWVKRGLVHPASVSRIFGNYGVEPPPAPRRAASAPLPRRLGTSTLLRAVLTLGAVLVGLGLILFVAANWQRIPASARLAGALGLTLLALHGGYHSRFGTPPRPRLGAALWLIALLGIGGVVALIGQTYHVQAGSYLLPLIWGVLCVPLALLLGFKPALYLASALWLWAYGLHFQEFESLTWIYPALLIGFLLPYSLVTRDRWLHRTQLAVLMMALILTLAASSFWHCSVLVAALVALRFVRRESRYDWLLVAGFLIWSFVYLLEFDAPNVFYALPLAYFYYRAHQRKSNALMIATVLNTQLWLLLFLLEANDWYGFEDAEGTGILWWLLASGLLWFGIGKRVETVGEWRPLSMFLRYAGGLLTGSMVYVFTFRFYDNQGAFYGSPLFMAATAALGAAGLAMAAAPLLGQAGRGRRSWGAPLVLALVAASFALSFVTPPSLPVHTPLFNVTLFAAALVLMLRGHRRQSLGWYNAGIGLFVVLIGSRYFDTFVEFLPRSVFFVLGGLFLIGWAVLADRQRRRRDA